MNSAGNVFFFARSPDAPRTVTVSVRSQGTPGRTSSRVEADTRRSRNGDEVAEEGRGRGRGEAIVVAAAPSLEETSAKALLVPVELILCFFFAVDPWMLLVVAERALERGYRRGCEHSEKGETR